MLLILPILAVDVPPLPISSAPILAKSRNSCLSCVILASASRLFSKLEDWRTRSNLSISSFRPLMWGPSIACAIVIIVCCSPIIRKLLANSRAKGNGELALLKTGSEQGASSSDDGNNGNDLTGWLGEPMRRLTPLRLALAVVAATSDNSREIVIVIALADRCSDAAWTASRGRGPMSPARTTIVSGSDEVPRVAAPPPSDLPATQTCDEAPG